MILVGRRHEEVSVMAQEEQDTRTAVSIVREAQPGQRSKPTKTLPTNRVAFGKQLDVIRAFAIAAGPTEKVVKTSEVAEIVSLHLATVQLVNTFLSDARLILKAEGGYLPASEVVAFNQAFAWNRDTAAHKLASVLRE